MVALRRCDHESEPNGSVQSSAALKLVTSCQICWWRSLSVYRLDRGLLQDLTSFKDLHHSAVKRDIAWRGRENTKNAYSFAPRHPSDLSILGFLSPFQHCRLPQLANFLHAFLLVLLPNCLLWCARISAGICLRGGAVEVCSSYRCSTLHKFLTACFSDNINMTIYWNTVQTGYMFNSAVCYIFPIGV